MVRVSRMVMADSAVPRISAGRIICFRFCTGCSVNGDELHLRRPAPPDRGEHHHHGAHPEARHRQHQDREGARQIVAGGVLPDRRIDADRDRDHQRHDQRHQAELEGDGQARGQQFASPACSATATCRNRRAAGCRRSSEKYCCHIGRSRPSAATSWSRSSLSAPTSFCDEHHVDDVCRGSRRTMTKTIRLAKNSVGISANNRRARYACIVRVPCPPSSLQREWTSFKTPARTIAPRAMRPFRGGSPAASSRRRTTFRVAEQRDGVAFKSNEVQEVFSDGSAIADLPHRRPPAVPVASETRAALPRLFIWASRRSRSFSKPAITCPRASGRAAA